MNDFAAVVLAAGRGARYRAAGGLAATKLLAEDDGVSLVRRVVEAALASRARPVLVVIGHEGALVRAALAGLNVAFVDNPRFAEGLSTSLAAGLAATPEGCGGAVVLLGDMPRVGAWLIDALIAAKEARPEALAASPSFAGRRGNPVLLSRALFADAMALRGDRGARAIVEALGPRGLEVEARDDGCLLDVDAPSATTR